MIDLGPLTFGQIAALNEQLERGICQRCAHAFFRAGLSSFCPVCGAARHYYGFKWTRPNELSRLGICRSCGLFLGRRDDEQSCPRCRIPNRVRRPWPLRWLRIQLG
jgi:rubrerythrin